MAKRKSTKTKRDRRIFAKAFKQEAVQMLLDGHSASSVSKNLNIGNTNLLYRWKAEQVADGGPVAEALDDAVRQLREELQAHQTRARYLKKSVVHFQPTRVAEVYEVISLMKQDGFEVTHLCEVLNVPRNGYYQWISSTENT